MDSHQASEKISAQIKDKLTEFRESFGNETVHELIDLYLNLTATQLEKLNEATAKQDLKAIHRIGHDLKSSSANMGVHSLRETCFQLEHLETTAKSAELCKQAHAEFESAKGVLVAELRRSA